MLISLLMDSHQLPAPDVTYNLSEQQQNGADFNTTRRCVLHLNIEAYVGVQGIAVCSDCERRYNDERRMSDGQFPRRPFLQELIKASAANA